MDRRLGRLLRSKLRAAGREFEAARRAYREGLADARDTPAVGSVDELRIVCRRHAERRTVRVDAEGRPDCFDADHPDCRGCAEDVRDGVVETW